MNGFSREEMAAYHYARAASVQSEAALAEFTAKWADRLRDRGLSLDGRPLLYDDDILIAAEPEPRVASDEPLLDWDSIGAIPPANLPAGVPEVDVLDFVAVGDDRDQEEWLAQGLVPKHGLTILGGNPKSGKTLLALDLCFAVATETSFCGRETAQAAFLFVTEEGTPGETRKRLRRLISSRGVPVLPGRLIHRRGIRFDDPRSWQLVRDAIGRLAQPTLLVLDPLRDLLVGDENDSNTIATVARSIHAILRDYQDVTVVLLHHLSKKGDGDGGQRLRGSTALWGTADNTIILKTDPMPDDSSEGGDIELRGFLSVEPRNAQRGRFSWRWDAETGQFLEASAEAKTLADKAAVHIGEHGPSTLASLAGALGTTADSIGVTLRRERSRFGVSPGEGPKDPSLWSLAE